MRENITIKSVTLLIFMSIIIFALCAASYVSAGADSPTSTSVNVLGDDVKLVALTYDDGPHPKYTPMILDVLKKHNANATFFVVGERAEILPEIVTRAGMEGHSIGNHTYSHADLTKLGEVGVISQISRTNEVVEGITGIRPTLMRPPLGARNKKIDGLIKGQNMYNIMWNVDPVDWNSSDAKLIYGKVVNKIQSGDIVVLHDFYPNTVTATDMILSTLSKQGYSFVTVEELLGLFEDSDEKAAREDVYYSGRPNAWQAN
jgi:peptidoglycan/xylan/chitin deacetylase (PgdA/CDA1 family)